MGAKKPKTAKRDALVVKCYQDEMPEQAMAKALLRPSVQAALTLKRILPNRDSTSIEALTEELSAQCGAAIEGKLGRGEAMLMAQAHTLDALFNQLVSRAARNQAEYLDAAERYFRLALRAQSQCRATIESLAMVKNPPNLAFVKQANIANGPQQVNNGAAPAAPRAETQNEQSKLLEYDHGERLDIGAAAPAVAVNSKLETVGAIDGAENKRR